MGEDLQDSRLFLGFTLEHYYQNLLASSMLKVAPVDSELQILYRLYIYFWSGMMILTNSENSFGPSSFSMLTIFHYSSGPV